MHDGQFHDRDYLEGLIGAGGVLAERLTGDPLDIIVRNHTGDAVRLYGTSRNAEFVPVAQGTPAVTVID